MYTGNDDTICAPATVPGTGAITVIRLSGENALEIADKVIECKAASDNSDKDSNADSGVGSCADSGHIASSKGYTIRFGTVKDESGKLLDEVLVSIFRAPHSYTGENSVEISCHASKYIADRLMQLLVKAGARTAEPGEFTRRAFLNGKMDLAQAEAVADLIASQNAAAHRVAINQLKGGFSRELSKMRAQMLHIVSLMELELDFSEEDVTFADRHELDTLLKSTIRHISTLMESFRLGNVIKNGVPVVIIGATNAGKSTLLNALLGEDRAIVSDVHGTTRDTIEETMTIDGILFRFIDTAGIRETSETIEKIGIERTFKKIREATVVLAMLDITRPEEDLTRSVNDILMNVDTRHQKLIFLLNKCDLSGGTSFGQSFAGSTQEAAAGAGAVASPTAESIAAAKDVSSAPTAGESVVSSQMTAASIAAASASAAGESVAVSYRASGADGIASAVEVAVATSAAGEGDVAPYPAAESNDVAVKVTVATPTAGGAEEASRAKSEGAIPAVASHVAKETYADKEISGNSRQMDDFNAANNYVIIKNHIVSLIEDHNIKLFGKYHPVEPVSKAGSIPPISIIPISAKSGEGLDALKSALASTQSVLISNSDTVLITNTRHYEALSNARDTLVRVRSGLSDALPTDLLTQDLREALYHIGSIVGEISTDEVLGNIFENFCIGK